MSELPRCAKDKGNLMKPYYLWDVETFRRLHLTTVAAPTYEQARRKAWKAIARKSPKLIPYFKENRFLCVQLEETGYYPGLPM